MKTIEQKVIGVIAEILQIAPATIRPEQTIYDLGADSIDLVEIVMGIEEFTGSISDDEAEAATTVQKLIDLAASKAA